MSRPPRRSGIAGKQRREVAVFSHAQDHDIKGTLDDSQSLPGLHGAGAGAGRIALGCRRAAKSQQLRARGAILQQVFTQQPFIAGGVVDVHPSFIGERDVDAIPLQRRLRQLPEEGHRRATAGYDQAGAAALCQR